MRDRLRRLLETVLPWYDPAVEAQREKESAETRVSAQQVRASYRAYAARLERK